VRARAGGFGVISATSVPWSGVLGVEL
jgi:hypothetical protein